MGSRVSNLCIYAQYFDPVCFSVIGVSFIAGDCVIRYTGNI